MTTITRPTYAEWVGDGVTRLFPVHFTYISPAYVHLSVNGVDVPFSWTSAGQIEAATAPALGASVRLYRSTPKDVLVAYADTSTPTATDLNTSYIQPLNILQESTDKSDYQVDDIIARMDAKDAENNAAFAAQGQDISDLIGANDTQASALTALAAALAAEATTRISNDNQIRADASALASTVAGHTEQLSSIPDYAADVANLYSANDTQASALTALTAALALETTTRISNDNQIRGAVSRGVSDLTFSASSPIFVTYSTEFAAAPIVIVSNASGDTSPAVQVSCFGATKAGFYVVAVTGLGSAYTGSVKVSWIATL